LYQRAFTHKSALKEYEQFTESFETLEFIGDSVLGFVITKFLFDRHESKQEGFLTKARTKLVRGETLAKIATKLGLEKLVIMDEKGMRNGWNNNPKILEDVFEALIGAIYHGYWSHPRERVYSSYLPRSGYGRYELHHGG
jgi:ribonuclease-3